MFRTAGEEVQRDLLSVTKCVLTSLISALTSELAATKAELDKQVNNLKAKNQDNADLSM